MNINACSTLQRYDNEYVSS